jgi:hypothetical protein
MPVFSKRKRCGGIENQTIILKKPPSTPLIGPASRHYDLVFFLETPKTAAYDCGARRS